MKIRKGKFTGHFFANANAPIPPDIVHRIRGYFPILEAQMDTTDQRFAARNQIYSDGVRILYSIIKNGPIPVYKVDVYIPPEISASIPIGPEEWILESGLIVSGPIPVRPLSIYTGTDLQAYFSGSGTQIPDTSVYEYLNGIAALSTTTCDLTNYVTDWPDTGPTLDGSNAYDSRAYETYGDIKTTVNTALFTGLMRLGMQCKIGAKKSESQLCGFGTLSGSKHGLLLDTQTYTFWSAQIDSTGASVKKLVNSEFGECIRNHLMNGDITEASEDYVRFLAWLISDLKDGTETAIEVLDSTDLADPYQNGMLPIAHGWKYSRLTNKASIVTYRETTNGTIPCGESGMWTISFTFAGDGTPSASIAEDTAPTKFRVNPGYHCLWWPANGRHNILRQALSSDPAQYTTFSGAVAPIYCWYDSEDELQTIEYEQYSTSTPGSYPYNEIFGATRACYGAAGFYQTRLHTSGTTFHSGGYVNSAVDIAQVTNQYVSGAVKETIYNWSYGTVTGEINVPNNNEAWPGCITTRWGFLSTSCVDAYNDIYDWSSGVLGGTTPVGVLTGYDHIYGSGEASIEVLEGEKLSFANVQVIPSGDAEAVYSVLLEVWNTTTRDYTTYVNEGVPSGDSYGNLAVWVKQRIRLRENVPPYAYYDYTGNDVFHGISFGAPFTQTPQTLGLFQCVVATGATPVSDTSVGYSTYDKANGALAVSSNTDIEISNTYSDWSYYIWTGVGSDELDLRVDSYSSYAGSAIYDIDSTVPVVAGSNIEIEGGYSPAYTDLPLYKRWIGWV